MADYHLNDSSASPRATKLAIMSRPSSPKPDTMDAAKPCSPPPNSSPPHSETSPEDDELERQLAAVLDAERCAEENKVLTKKVASMEEAYQNLLQEKAEMELEGRKLLQEKTKLELERRTMIAAWEKKESEYYGLGVTKDQELENKDTKIKDLETKISKMRKAETYLDGAEDRILQQEKQIADERKTAVERTNHLNKTITRLREENTILKKERDHLQDEKLEFRQSLSKQEKALLNAQHDTDAFRTQLGETEKHLSDLQSVFQQHLGNRVPVPAEKLSAVDVDTILSDVMKAVAANATPSPEYSPVTQHFRRQGRPTGRRQHSLQQELDSIGEGDENFGNDDNGLPSPYLFSSPFGSSTSMEHSGVGVKMVKRRRRFSFPRYENPSFPDTIARAAPKNDSVIEVYPTLAEVIPTSSAVRATQLTKVRTMAEVNPEGDEWQRLWNRVPLKLVSPTPEVELPKVLPDLPPLTIVPTKTTAAIQPTAIESTVPTPLAPRPLELLVYSEQRKPRSPPAVASMMMMVIWWLSWSMVREAIGDERWDLWWFHAEQRLDIGRILTG
ncbi:hypothetical protein K461DRAFT_322553 [Myriangium duriaei CBS 260.36]|uniref:Uncharacterized protein n=1 Tax=Myriangium duriaei CBS 260.36 TaxID=1168546 RepID=A0A9P4MIP9_9PEZI|nr:hypothetical protein K461DRAFT_322553 [Myriangium duriaei CBS 260.36]